MNIITKARNLATILLASLITLTVHSLGLIGYGNLTDDATVAEKYINMEEAPLTNQLSAIGKVINMELEGEQTLRIGLTEDYLNVNYTSLKADAEISVKEHENDELNIRNILGNLEEAKKQLQEEKEAARQAEAKARLNDRSYTLSKTQGGLVDISNPDPNYTGTKISITGKDREILEKLVMGEAGNQGFEGAAMVAQCIRDMYILGNYDSVDAVRRNCGYSGKLIYEPNQDVLDAVAYIFDEGGYAVKHRILYFYAPQYSAGKWHNTQNLIIHYKGHKFFDRW